MLPPCAVSLDRVGRVLLHAQAAAAADAGAMRRIAGGDAEGLTLLYGRYRWPLQILAYRITGDARDAEEVVQDVFIQVWRQADRYSGARGAVLAWLLVMARSRAIDRLRSRSRTLARELEGSQWLETHGADEPGTDAVLMKRERVDSIRQAIVLLPPSQRLVVELTFFEDLTAREIALRTAQPLGTVKTRIRLGLRTLRGRPPHRAR
jgi:RNA polymerase sigma-70 factor, ECF subfamily